MKKIETIEEVHHVILEIAKEFHNLCLKHSIPYYMGYGTMLGAVRHQGFIPWDDDMDFLVHRKDLARLKEILRRELPLYYRYRDRRDGIGLYGEISKIEDTRTRISEISNPNHANEYGLFIDIFPLDVAKNNTMHFLSRNWIIAHLFRCEHNSALKYRIAKHIVGGVDRISCVVATKGNYYVEYNSVYFLKSAMPKAIYGTPKLYKFEDTELYGVQDPHAYLSFIYGDYMQMPSEGERHLHLKEMFYIE